MGALGRATVADASAARERRHHACALGALALTALSVVVGPATPCAAAPHRALFVGNSYTYGNAPLSFPDRYRALREALGGGPVVAESVTKGGWTFAKHASDAKTQGEPLQAALLESWDTIFLQGQSQLPGFFGVPNGPFPAEQKGFVGLVLAASAASPRLLLLLTWGRRDGDKANPALFGTFSAMQGHLDAGTAALAQAAVAAGVPVSIVPVGGAFRLLHDLEASPGSRFASLYDADGSHPSPLGSHLMALCAIAVEGEVDPRTLAAPAGLDAVAVAEIAEAAASACYSPAAGGSGADGGADGAAGGDAGVAADGAADPDGSGGTSDDSGGGDGADSGTGDVASAADDGDAMGGVAADDATPPPAPGAAAAAVKGGGCQVARAQGKGGDGWAALALTWALWLGLWLALRFQAATPPPASR